jgi:hypothetical protein
LKIYHKFFITLAAVLCIANIILGIFGQQEFGVYFTIDAVAFILVVLSFNLDSNAMTKLRPLGAILFIGFLMIIIFKIYKML